MAKTAIGVDFGHAYVKIAELVRVRGKIAARKLASLPIPDGSVNRGRIVDDSAVVNALQEPVQRLGLRSCNVVLGITSPDVLVRQLTLPPMSKKELRETIRWELLTSSQFSGQEEDLTFDYSVLNSSDGSRQEIVVVAARRSLVEEYYRLLKKVGLAPRIVDLNVFALPHVWDKPGNICFVDIGVSFTEVLFVKTGEYGLFRLIAFGGRRLENKMSGGWEQAATGLGDLSLGSRAPTALELSAVHTDLHALLDQLHQTLEFLRAQARVHSIRDAVDEVVLSGGVARLDGLAEFLSAGLGCPVSYLDPCQHIKVDARALAGFPLAGLGDRTAPLVEFAGSLGLARRGLAEL